MIDRVVQAPLLNDEPSAIGSDPFSRVLTIDGKDFGVAFYGDPTGYPVFYFHGFPTSRLEAALAHATADRLGIALIAIDRPGFGYSTHTLGRRIAHWPETVGRIADTLSINDFSVLGVSGGAPYAFATAAGLSDRVNRLAVVGGITEFASAGSTDGMMRFDRWAIACASTAPWTSGLLCWAVGRRLLSNPDKMLESVAAMTCDADKASLARPRVNKLLKRAFTESIRHGTAGVAWELRLMTSPWGVDFENIRCPASIYHGESDRIVPACMARLNSKRLPNADVRLYPDDGHYSLPIGRMEEVFAALTP